MYGNDRGQMRRIFLEAWRKAQAGEVLQPMEALIADLVGQHPEYHGLFKDGELAQGKDFSPDLGETNPFLHLSLHISLKEQLGTDRPAGIRVEYQRLLKRWGDAHEVEHKLMECLAALLWQAQRNGQAPDEQSYLDCVRRLN